MALSHLCVEVCYGSSQRGCSERKEEAEQVAYHQQTASHGCVKKIMAVPQTIY